MKRVVSLLLVGILLLTPVFSASDAGLTLDGMAATLAEISDATGLDYTKYGGFYPLYQDEAIYLWERRILSGSGASLDLDKPMTRATAITMIVRLLGAETAATQGDWTTPFIDIPDWAAPYVGYAYENGITNGTSATTYGSEVIISANTFLVLLLRAMGYVDSSLSDIYDYQFSNAAEQAKQIDLIDDSLEALFTRTNFFVRDQMVAVCYRALWNAACKDETSLRDTVTLTVVRTGSVPPLMEGIASIAPGDPTETGDPTGQLKLSIGRRETIIGSRSNADFTYDFDQSVIGCILYAVLEVSDYSGDATLDVIINGEAATHTLTVQQGRIYQLALTLRCDPIREGGPQANVITLAAHGARASVTLNCRAVLSDGLVAAS